MWQKNNLLQKALSILGKLLILGGGVLLPLWLLVFRIDFDFVIEILPALIEGMYRTGLLVGISFSLGGFGALLLTFLRRSNSTLARSCARAFGELMRGTPFLLQLFFVYYGLGSFSEALKAVGMWWLFQEAWPCAIIVLTLNTAAYQAEILVGALEHLPSGQIQAAQALGLSESIIFWRILFPQALLSSLRAYGNELIYTIKGSAAVSLITLLDLTGMTRLLFSETYNFQVYWVAAALYFCLVQFLQLLCFLIERFFRDCRPI